MLRLFAVPLLVSLALATGQGAAGAELVVASAAAMQGALDPALPSYPDASVRITYGTAGQVGARAVEDSKLDIVILPPARLKSLADKGIVAADGVVPLGVAEIGVALRDGTPRIETDTVAKLREALLAAPAVGIADPLAGATTGVHLAEVLRAAGLDKELGPRLRVYPDGTQAMQALSRGEVGIAMGQISELRPVPGIFETGKVPPEWQLRTVYAGAVVKRSSDPEAAHKLLAWMASPTLAPYLDKVGLERP
jgi:molybdate transport system substrate-binding protein